MEAGARAGLELPGREARLSPDTGRKGDYRRARPFPARGRSLALGALQAAPPPRLAFRPAPLVNGRTDWGPECGKGRWG